jgi:hypothetical protein
MRFILVNGRTPTPLSFCALCCEPITASYLRETATRLTYCDQRCYAEYHRAPIPALRNLARA